MKNKLRKVLSKEIPISVLKKTLALLLTFLMVLTSGDFSGLYANGIVQAEGTNQTDGNATFAVTGAIYDNDKNLKGYTKELPINLFSDGVNEQSVLGEAWNYGITAEEWQFNKEAETNFAVKLLTGTTGPLDGGQTGIDEKADGSDAGKAIVGAINGKTSIKEKPLIITAPKSVQSHLTTTGNAWIHFITDSQENINQKIDGMIKYVNDRCSELSKKDSIIDYDNVLRGNQDVMTLDFTHDQSLKPSKNTEKKTIYIDVDKWKVAKKEGGFWTLADAFKNNGQLTIQKYSNQVLVFNFGGQKVDLSQIKVKNYFPDGSCFDDGTTALANKSTGLMDVASTLIFNMPNATDVSMWDSCGIFLAPNAKVTFHGVGGGWLVAKTAISDAEWHFVNGKLPDTFSPGEVNLAAKKTVEGKEPGQKQFNFTLYQKDSNGWTPKETKQNNDGNITFTPIKYDYQGDNIQSYLYRISENDQTVDGILYHPEIANYYAKVTVTGYTNNTNNTNGEPVKHCVSSNVEYFKDENCKEPCGSVPTFNNVTKQTSIDITGQKTLTGRSLKNGESYTFKLTEVNSKEDKTVKQGGVSDTVKVNKLDNNNQGSFTFHLNYTKPTDAGNHYYLISEDIPTDVANNNNVKDGLKYDSHKVLVHVYVTDDLSSAKIVQEDSEPIAFVNTYKPTGCQIQFHGKKTLTGRKLNPEEFTFELDQTDENYQNATHVQFVTNGAGTDLDKQNKSSSGTFDFGTISYDKAGTYYYVISEVGPTDDNTKGLTYDSHKVYVKVTVTDDKGQLKASAKYYDKPKDGQELTGDYPIAFNNQYEAKGDIQLTGTKTLNGRDLKAGEFSFTIKDDQTEKTRTGTLEKGANAGEAAQITFPKISYKLKDVGTHHYTVTEDESKLPGIQKNTQTFHVTVKVSDKGDGTLGISKEITDADGRKLGENEPIAFVNTYQPKSCTIQFHGKKTLTGRKLNPEEFTFALEKTDANYKNKTGKVVERVTNGDGTVLDEQKKSSGTFDFGQISYDKAGTYYYVISEVGPTDDNTKGLTYDSHKVYVQVTVTDDNGKLTASAKYYDKDGTELTGDDPIAFENKYEAKGDIQLTGTKTLIGRDLKEGEFSFTIKEDKTNPEKTWTGTLKKGANAGEAAQITFPQIDYTLDDLGTHSYTVTEDASNLPGIKKNTQAFHVTVDVTDKGDGTLGISKEITDADGRKLGENEPIAFVNRYTASPVALRLSGTKILSGADMTQFAGFFRFELLDSSKKTLDTAKNDASGRFTFAPIEYDKEGEYTYIIRERNGGKTIDGIKYDGSAYQVTVHVADDGKGQLIANTSLQKMDSKNKVTSDKPESITFQNQKLTKITVTKKWNDNSNQEGLRPKSITLELLNNGEVVRTTELSGVGDTWTYTFENLEPGKYTVHEICDSPYYEVDHNDQTADTTVTSGVNETTGETAVTLTNTFGRKVDVTAYKDLTGAKLLDGEFRFKLHRNSDIDSSKDLEAVNNADGTINFSDVDYDAKGYTVYELRDSSLTDISFDEKNSVDPASVNAIDFTKTGIHFNADGEPTDERNYTIRNQYRPIVLRVQKRSKSAPYDPLVNAVYGLYQVNQDGNDLLVESELSDANGYMYYGRIEPGVVYYFKEISAPAGHEVDPYPGQHFMVKYVGDGKIAVYDETGKNKLDYGDITESKEEKDKPNRTIQVDSEKTDLDSITANANEEKYSYSGNGIKAVATAAKGLLPEGTKLVVTKVDPKKQVASYQSPTGIQTQNLNDMLEDNVGDFTGLAYYDISFVKDGKEVEPTGDVHVTLEPDQGLDLKGADPSDLKIIHIVESGEPEDLTRTISLVNGSVATDGKSVLQTSLTSDSFSIYALVDPKDSTLKGNYLLTAAGVGDFTAKLKVAKVDSSGNFIPNATLRVYKFDATKKDGLGEKVLEWTSADGVQDWQRKIDVEKPYVLVETNAPKGYKIADNIYFSIGKYNSALTCYAYDAKTGKLTESDELTQKNTNGSELVMVDDPIMVTTNYKTKVIPNHKSRTEDKVLYVPGSPKTGEIPVSMPVALPLASMLGLILILSGYFVRKKKKAEK